MDLHSNLTSKLPLTCIWIYAPASHLFLVLGVWKFSFGAYGSILPSQIWPLSRSIFLYISQTYGSPFVFFLILMCGCTFWDYRGSVEISYFRFPSSYTCMHIFTVFFSILDLYCVLFYFLLFLLFILNWLMMPTKYIFTSVHTTFCICFCDEGLSTCHQCWLFEPAAVIFLDEGEHFMVLIIKVSSSFLACILLCLD